ncbi:MAG: hypothetical protein KA155_01440 [Alphaproteobacteria bacterium]|jgi:hypothetical protein|nr:hypothetical protein [Alphaproteobacteria bacterium]
MEKKNPDQFYRIQGDTGNYEFYHRRNDAAGNSKYVFVQVDVRTNPEHTELLHKSNNRIRLSEALWFPEGQTPSEPYDPQSSRIVGMVMNRDLGLKELVDLKSKIDTMLEQGYKPSAYDLRALKNFMDGAQYNAGLDGGDPRLALVTLSINRAILGRDQVWAHFNNGKYDGGEKFETALKEFLKDEDGFWRNLLSDPSLGVPRSVPDLKTLTKGEPLKTESLPDPLPGNEPREFLVLGPNPHYQEEMGQFYKGLSREQKALFTDNAGPFAGEGALGISTEGLSDANHQHLANLKRFEESLTPDQKKKLDELNNRGWGRFVRPDDGIERAPNVPILTPRELSERFFDPDEFKRILEEAKQAPQTSLSEKLLEKPLSKPLETLQDYFERTSLKRVICVSGNEGDTRQMLEDAGMTMSKVPIEKGGAMAAGSKLAPPVAPDLETPPPAVQKNTVFTA